MTPPLTVLALAVLLQAAQLGLAAILSDLDRGLRYNAGPRDGPPPPERPVTARLKRAAANHGEALVLFAPAVLVAHLTVPTPFQTAAAWTYLAARVLYVPAYAGGWTPWRSVFWIAGFLATVAVAISTLI
ncbi:MAPEG family protein [Jannaschia sp. LMIT008]|uniref:MAPEG family protein n=1 Tax=Jannaschia maritima TaxID=3032585 RepID=UPI002811EDCF|nr:MAPEG family protein [Jannaschia sp. LMIT008]